MVSEHDRPASTTLRASSSLAAIGDRPLQEPVVDRQVGPAGPAAASRDAPRQHVDRGVVGDAAALDDPERRLACRLETRGLARPADRPERAPPAGGVHPVDPLDEPRRHVAPDRRLPEGPRPGDDGGHEREGVPDRGALPEGPGEDGDPAAAVGEDLHRRRAHADEQAPPVPGGPGDVLAPVGLDVAALVGAGGDPPHRVELHAGKGAHGGEVLPVGLPVRPAVAAARRRVGPRAPLGEERVELGERAERRHGDEEVAPEEPHGVLDGALLVSRIGVAVPALEAVVGSELREQPRFRDLAAYHPARLGGVVEHHRRRGAAPAAEDLEQPGAQALRPLRHEGDALPVVRVRKRRDQQLEVEGPPADRGAEVPEIDLAGAGRPLELEVPLSARRRPGEPELADEPLHGGVRAAVAALGDEPVVDPPGCVALLPRGPEVGLENARDPFLVALERGPAPPPGHRRGGRHVLHVGVLRHGVPAHVEHSGDLGPRAPGGIHRPYIIHCVQGHGHLLHPSRAGSPK